MSCNQSCGYGNLTPLNQLESSVQQRKTIHNIVDSQISLSTAFSNTIDYADLQHTANGQHIYKEIRIQMFTWTSTKGSGWSKVTVLSSSVDDQSYDSGCLISPIEQYWNRKVWQ